ncbi:SIR2 family protein [Croceimicrobium hydrocarbonivorans]|uniref:SIR2 family protein n=1 Tax=Croceimicrobium hydrocarbonivorans TaxID=2761580 RepID=A0A7H0VGM8_9FLAO|nr:SIR2 family protein [Croceimicrobium hydrocarbonivorans]QNR24876.1 SIR2 family protein [Croceimicrobium hydrocarbonivorans]
MKQTSILLGAGFSVNQGYPTANQFNEILVNLDPEDFCVHTDGTVIKKNREDEDPFWYTQDSKHRHFVTRLIQLYKELSEGLFNYEEFYDFYNEIRRGERECHEFDELCNGFREEFHSDTDNINLISRTNNILNQLISIFLVDRDGNKFYKPVNHGKPIYPGYSGFLYCMEKWGSESIVHIHTLNHDLFLETFKSSDWIQGELSDGFEEIGSPYYGNFKENYKVRLPRFTNHFDKKFRLYKLHGSVDQFPFHIQNQGIDTYVKIKLGIGTSDLFKEVQENGKPKYINDWINYHPDFLSGTTSKILRYREPWYYDKVFTHFEENLKNSEQLIIIGYGCGDIEINRLIEECFDFENKMVNLVEPYPSDKSREFVKKFKGRLIEKTPDNLSIDDFKK